MRTTRAGVGIGLLVLAFAPDAVAGESLRLERSKTQHGLEVSVEPGSVALRACRGKLGAPAKGDGCGRASLKLPSDLGGPVTLQAITLEGGRRVALAQAPGKRTGERYVALFTAPGRRDKPEPRIILKGFTGRRKGKRQRSRELLVRSAGSAQEVLLGHAYAGADVCGRRSVVVRHRLDPADLELTAVKRFSAVDLGPPSASAAASPTGEPFDLEAARSVIATVASSAVGGVRSEITDGRLATMWRQGRAGDGRGEFVVMKADPRIPTLGLELAFRPTGKLGVIPEPPPAPKKPKRRRRGKAEAPKRPATAARAPKSLFVVTRKNVVKVAVASDPWGEKPAASYRVRFAQPEKTDCVALVLDTPHDGDAPVGVVEARTVTPLDGKPWADVVRALDGPGRDVAAATLEYAGRPAMTALAAGYDALKAEGKATALEVVETRSCAEGAPLLARVLTGKGRRDADDVEEDRLAIQARDRLRACRPAATKALTALLEKAPDDVARIIAAQELALIAPKAAASAIAARLHELEPGTRRALRSALSSALAAKKATTARAGLLAAPSFGSRPLVTRIDILRAFGERLAKTPGGGTALQQTWGPQATFRTRYLLLGPAGHLARSGDAHATDLLRRSLSDDPSAHVRAAAARAAAGIDTLAAPLVGTLAHVSPRVRGAGLQALGGVSLAQVPGAEQRVLALLAQDPWTFVRVGAAKALAKQPRTKPSDEALMKATEDRSRLVRRAALRALGARKSHIAAQVVHDVGDNANEALSVRIAAIAALGAMCRKDASPLLYKLALRAGRPQVPYDEKLGLAALAALGDIKPSNLKTVLAPLLDKRVRAHVRQIAKDVITRRGACR